MWLSCREGQCEVLGFCVLWGNRASGPTCREAGFIFLPLSGVSGSLALWWGTRALLLSVSVGSAGLLCSVGREVSWCQQVSKASSLGFTWVCGGRLLALYSKLRVTWDSKAGRLKSSGAHQTAVDLESIWIGVWVSRSHSSCCQLRRTELVGSRCSRAWFPTQASVLWDCCPLGRTKPPSVGSIGPWYPAQASGSLGPWHCCRLRRIKPGCSRSSRGLSKVLWQFCWGNWACWLMPSVTHGAIGVIGLAYMLLLIPLAFQDEGSRSCIRQEHGAPSSWVCRASELTAKWWCLELCCEFRTEGLRVVELWVALSILPVVSFSSTWGFSESFTSHWLWDPTDAFWGPLICLYLG
jgi:hypothetical protein